MSSDQKVKPKVRRSPAVYIVMGVLIGVLASGAALIFLSARSSESIGVAASATPAPSATAAPAIAIASPVVPAVRAQNLPTRDCPETAVRCLERVGITDDGTLLVVLENQPSYSTVHVNRILEPMTLRTQTISSIGDQGFYAAFAFNMASADVVVTNAQQQVFLFDSVAGELLSANRNGRLVAYSTDGDSVALYEPGRGIRIYDPTLTTPRATVTLDLPQVIDQMALSEDDTLVYSVGNVIYIRRVTDETAQRAITMPDDSTVRNLRFHPNGRWLAIVTETYLRVADINEPQFADYPFEIGGLEAVAFSADSKWLALVGGDAEAEAGVVMAVRWPADGPLPSNSAAYTPVELQGHTQIVRDATFTPDGHLLTAAWDGTVRLWDLEAGEQLALWQP